MKRVLLTAVCSIFLLAGCAPLAFTEDVQRTDLEKILSDNGIELCTETTVNTDFSPGMLEGKSWTLSKDCVQDPQELRATVLRFDSEAALNTAFRNISSIHRNGFGPHFAYAWGPYLIAIEGEHPVELRSALGRALINSGAGF